MGQIKEEFRVLWLEHESTINMQCFVVPKNVSSDLSTECGFGKFLSRILVRSSPDILDINTWELS